MRGSATQAVLERLSNGCKCDVTGCYEMAVWSVTYKDVTLRWCPKHTKMKMRDPSFW